MQCLFLINAIDKHPLSCYDRIRLKYNKVGVSYCGCSALRKELTMLKIINARAVLDSTVENANIYVDGGKGL